MDDEGLCSIFDVDSVVPNHKKEKDYIILYPIGRQIFQNSAVLLDSTTEKHHSLKSVIQVGRGPNCGSSSANLKAFSTAPNTKH